MHPTSLTSALMSYVTALHVNPMCMCMCVCASLLFICAVERFNLKQKQRSGGESGCRWARDRYRVIDNAPVATCEDVW